MSRPRPEPLELEAPPPGYMQYSVVARVYEVPADSLAADALRRAPGAAHAGDGSLPCSMVLMASQRDGVYRAVVFTPEDQRASPAPPMGDARAGLPRAACDTQPSSAPEPPRTAPPPPLAPHPPSPALLLTSSPAPPLPSSPVPRRASSPPPMPHLRRRR